MMNFIYKSNGTNKSVGTIGKRLVAAVIKEATKNAVATITVFNELDLISVIYVGIVDTDIFHVDNECITIECTKSEIIKAIEECVEYAVEANNYAVTEEAPEETSTPAEIADHATAEIFHIIDNMPENASIEYSMEAIHVKPTNNNTFVVIADTKRFGKNQVMFESYDIMQCVEYVKNSIYTTPAAPTTPAPAFRINMQYFATKQQYTSANTSINNDKIPAVFSKLINNSIKLNINPANSIILDSGCGKYPEIISEYLLDSGCEYAGRDPYNQPEYINNIVFPTKCKNAEALKKHRVFTSSNVLNVIPGINNRIAYINSIKDIMQAGEKLYITVYPGDSSGIGRPTAEDCWQENRKYKDYIPELEAAGFTKVTPKYGMLICEL